ncbi:hypothetical protein V6N13_059158 [Hibiscus sabdariffa]
MLTHRSSASIAKRNHDEHQHQHQHSAKQASEMDATFNLEPLLHQSKTPSMLLLPVSRWRSCVATPIRLCFGLVYCLRLRPSRLGHNLTFCPRV